MTSEAILAFFEEGDPAALRAFRRCYEVASFVDDRYPKLLVIAGDTTAKGLHTQCHPWNWNTNRGIESVATWVSYAAVPGDFRM